jgi:hypothetical protein
MERKDESGRMKDEGDRARRGAVAMMGGRKAKVNRANVGRPRKPDALPD